MAFIKAQKLVYDEDGKISSGSAAVVDTIYDNTGKYHAKHKVREKLGKVLYLSQDKQSGIFLSPTRGLVEYNADQDAFQTVEQNDLRLDIEKVFPTTEIHTIFGDAYLLFEFLEKSGLLQVLQKVFSKKSEYERLICHVLHGVLKDGSHISCDNYIGKSFASYILQDVPLASLKSDTCFFSFMGKDSVKMDFFKAFMCFRNNSGMVTVETPSKKVKEYYKQLGIGIPAHVDSGKYRKAIGGLNV